MESAIACGIYCGGGGDNPRNGMCSPLSGVQQGEAFDVAPYAETATEYIRAMVDTLCAHGNYENRAKAHTRYMQETL